MDLLASGSVVTVIPIAPAFLLMENLTYNDKTHYFLITYFSPALIRIQSCGPNIVVPRSQLTSASPSCNSL